MLDKDAGRDGVVATFHLPVPDGARTAAVVGEFNDWSRDANPMFEVEGGFRAQIALEPGRAYRFRYLVDGERWENDWAADAYVPNEFGGDDSLIDLRDIDVAEPAPKKKASRARKAPAADAGAATDAAPAKPKAAKKASARARTTKSPTTS